MPPSENEILKNFLMLAPIGARKRYSSPGGAREKRPPENSKIAIVPIYMGLLHLLGAWVLPKMKRPVHPAATLVLEQMCARVIDLMAGSSQDHLYLALARCPGIAATYSAR